MHKPTDTTNTTNANITLPQQKVWKLRKSLVCDFVHSVCDSANKKEQEIYEGIGIDFDTAEQEEYIKKK